jgi:uncharacterized protein YndB with AHSA1/START domain
MNPRCAVACWMMMVVPVAAVAQNGAGWAEPGPAASAAAARAAAEDGVAPDPVVSEAIVNAPIHELWKVFSTGEGFTKLGVAKADIDLRVGGLIRSSYDAKLDFADERTIQNEIISFEPERMISIRIHRPPLGFPFMEAYKQAWTVISLTDLGGTQTHVRTVMLGFGADDESRRMREFFQKGNDWTMQKLKAGFDEAVTVSPAGSAHTGGALDPILEETVVAAPREKVWEALTTSAGWKSCIGVESKIGRLPGEPFEIYFGSDAPAGERGSEGCTILSSVPGEMFSYTWNAPPKLPKARARRTWVVLEFQEVSAKATRVKLRQYGFAEMAGAHPEEKEEFEATRAYFQGAWPRVLGAVREHFGEGSGGKAGG